MKKHNLPAIEITHDISDYDAETAKALSEIGGYIQQFFTDHKIICKVNKTVAARLLKDFDSRNRAVSAEAHIIAEKASKPNIEIKEISVTSSDAYYLQLKTGGIYVRQEIKSVIREGAADIDAEIINAESQHKSRLKDEKDEEPTWHKTTIVIGSEENPWPFSKIEDFEKFQKDRDKILRQAEYRIKRVVLGAVAPKSDRAPLELPVVGKLLAAEKDREGTKFLKSQAPKKGGMKKPKALRVQLEVYKENAKSEKKKKNKDRIIEERLQRQLLVVERIRIVNPYKDFTITLDRQAGGQFRAHFKEEKLKDSAYAKLPRRHWYEPEGFRTKHRKYPDGNTALHEAAKNGDIRLVIAYQNQGVREINTLKQTPLHQAAMNNHDKVVEFILKKDKGVINMIDAAGNTALHLAYLSGSQKAVDYLVSQGADQTIRNDDGKIPIELAKKSLYTVPVNK